MAMHNPPHPGEFINSAYLEPNDISGWELVIKLGVATSTLSRVLKGSSAVSPEMALRLSKALGRSMESWLAMDADSIHLEIQLWLRNSPRERDIDIAEVAGPSSSPNNKIKGLAS